MKGSINMKTHIKPVAAAIALALAAGPIWAVEDFYLATKPYTKYLPDGSTPGFPVTMWGYVEDTGGTCYGITGAGSRKACVDALPDPAVPGPQLLVPPGETQVRIFLTNGLTEPTSIVIPGQEMPWSNANNGPTWNDGSTGARGASTTKRVRSFGREAGPNGGRRAYVWNTSRGTNFDGPGTFLYHSGTHPQKQVYMGLAGMLSQDASAGLAYPGVPYDNEVTLFYSDIDPDFNEAVATGTLDTTIDRHPTWFLVNGKPYEANVTSGIAAGAAGEDLLLRMVSTATDTHVAVLQGLNMTLHAEDGQQYNYQVGATSSTPAPRVQYSAMLPPAKTRDATLVAPLQGDYAVYDGNGYMTNPSSPANEAAGDEVGGMLRFLAVGGGGTNRAPTANHDAASVVEGFSTNINVLGNDTDPENDPISIASYDATGTPGSVACVTGVTAGACTYDASGVAEGTPDVTFTYIATDGTNPSTAATVTLTVTANQAPTAADDTASADVGGAQVAIDVLDNDTDPEGQPLSVVASGPTGTALVGSVICTATVCQYTPPATGPGGTDTFTYTATDGINTSDPATVTVTVAPQNLAPTAVDDPTLPGDAAFSTGSNTQLVGIDVLGNDTDPETDPLSIASYDASGTAGGSVACVTGAVNGTCTYTPDTDFVGTDTFTYTATDGVNTSNSATVTVTVTGAGAPVLYFSTTGAGSVPGVAGPYDDADLYTVDAGDVFSRLYDAVTVTDLGLPNGADIDGISVNGTAIYASFAASSTNVPGVGNVPDEDVVVYDTVGGTWGTYFDGSLCGLDTGNGQDIDAVSVSGGTLYFSSVGGGNGNPVGGVAGPYDDADVYSWNGGTTGTANCDRELNARNGPSANIGLPGNADIDGLTVEGTTYHMSFNRNGGTSVPGLGTVQDEAVVSYDSVTGIWSVFRANGELGSTNSQDVDAIHVP